MRSLLLSALFVTVLFSGCTDRGPGLDLEQPPITLVTTDPQTGEELFLKPNLTVGRWWDVRLAVDYGNGFIFDLLGKIVVSQAKADGGFRLGSDTTDFGVFDSYFDSFYVGELDANLNPTIGADKAQFFQWPLKAGQTWETKLLGQGFDTFSGRVDDVKFNVTAFEEDTTAYAPRLRVQGLTSHGETLDFDYSARTGWMTYFRMINQTTGRVIVAVDFRDTGLDFSGQVHHITQTTLYEKVRLTPPFDPSLAPIPPVETVQVPDGFAFIDEIKALFTFEVEAAGGGQVVVTVTLPNGTVHPTLHTGINNLGKFERRVDSGQLAGTWSVGIVPAATGGAFVGLYGFKDDLVELR